MGIEKLRKLQIGAEDTMGTAVAATSILRMNGMPDDQRETMFVDEHVGYLSGVDRTYVPKLLAALTSEGEATFEQLPYLLNAAVENSAGVQDGAGSGYVYTYDLPTTAQNTLKTYTIEGGDDQQAEELEYCFVENMVLSGAPGEAWKATADWLGRQVSKTTFTASLDLPMVEEILFSKSKLYIDAADGTIGTTVKSSVLLGAELSIKTGWAPVFTGDGKLYFTFIKCVDPEVLLKVTFEHNATAVAEKDAWIAQTARLMRLLVQGSALGTSGAYTYKTLQIDLAGKWEDFEVIGAQDGNDIVTGTLRARYNATADLFGQVVVVNELSALP